MSLSQQDRKQKILYSIVSGGSASVFTQPFEVIKTQQVCNPNKTQIIEKGNSLQSFYAASKEIYLQNKKGILNFFRGASVGFFRQALGFSIYSQILEELNDITKKNEKLNQNQTPKYIKTAFIAGISKVIAIVITCPLIVLKTRLELVVVNKNTSLFKEIKMIIAEKGYFRGLNGVISRELSFSVFQYTTFQFLKQVFDENQIFQGNTFVAPYTAGILGVILSQPFEVVRNRMMIQDNNLPSIYRYTGLLNGFSQIYMLEGSKGFFNGLIPRLVRKPINTGISWGIYELLKQKKKYPQY
ncbi:carrier protein (macronuclear) [Tetrahymena thermophila SB210]|uniref:Carrier protein n=1 Tax=Tetrahymena thermophila (strain SB210) TaxID=312017 RepID=Q24GE6_TETTS|nr:carrier protein [Tetrahymena thermophila SB210]EAS06925.2 carrier protein [Tetrahymena thermophila SB210]|eukprot:XP_001027167.2 carrier protein [Tetrahymena thermophila SB210]